MVICAFALSNASHDLCLSNMSDEQIILACGLWYIAGYVSGFLSQKLKIEKLRLEIANLKAMDSLIKVLNA